MRLINTRTLELEEFTDADRPVFAILSHRWQGEEVTVQQFKEPAKYGRYRGYQKIREFCAQALQDGYEWAWADTCCIDKAAVDSNELSEAINSMYQWYEEAGRCYVYLCDVRYDTGWTRDFYLQNNLERSEWFTRGWTLQELIAPTRCAFFDRDWKCIGTKRKLANVLAKITRIDVRLLSGQRSLETFSIAQKMSWAAFRRTTKTEDRAYSLCGLFGIKLPTIYGEGHEAFLRLQKMLMERSTDQSLFAWTRTTSPSYDERRIPPELVRSSLFAPSPDNFYASSHIVPHSAESWTNFWSTNPIYCSGKEKTYCADARSLPASGPFGTNNLGFQITLLVRRLVHDPIPCASGDRVRNLYEAALYCYDESFDDWSPCTIIMGQSLDGMHRLAPFHVGEVYRQPHSRKHDHWIATEISVPTSCLWIPQIGLPPYSENEYLWLEEWRNRSYARICVIRRNVHERITMDTERNVRRRRHRAIAISGTLAAGMMAWSHRPRNLESKMSDMRSNFVRDIEERMISDGAIAARK